MLLHGERNDHLGMLLEKEYFLPRNLSIYRVVKDTGIEGRILCRTLAGRQKLQLKEAVLLARYFGEEDGFFAKKQLEYDLQNEQEVQEKQLLAA